MILAQVGIIFVALFGQLLSQPSWITQSSTSHLQKSENSLNPSSSFPSPICTILPGGLARLSSGVDITSLDLFKVPSGVGTGHGGGFKGPVINFTCGNGQLWTNEYNGEEYQVPEQIWTISNIPGESDSRDVNTFMSSEDVKNYLASVMGVNYENGMFALSASYASLLESIEGKQSQIITQVSASFSSTEAMLLPTHELQLGSHATRFLETLNPDYDSDREAYQEFIDTFGTHFFSSAKFGPFVRNQFSVNREFAQQKSFDYIQAESVKWFSKWFSKSALGKEDDSFGELNENFTSETVQTVEIFGGNSELFSSNSWKDWIKSAIGVPWIFSGKLVPIYELIEYQNLKASMKQAVSDHILKAFATDLELRTKNGIHKYSDGGGNVDSLKSIQKELAMIKEDHVADEKFSEHLDKALKYNLDKPNWWPGTQICFRYHNDVPGGFCSGQNPTCAPVNEFTSLYQDWSRKKGGCHMSWGLFNVAKTEQWFSNSVKLCLKFEATGDSQQCGNGTLAMRKEICVDFNEYSPAYHDQTDFRTGGCKLAWKVDISNPELAPTWFLNSRLCYRYRTYNRHAAFNEPGMQAVCGFMNEYTDFFMDDSYYNHFYNYVENFIQWGIFDTPV